MNEFGCEQCYGENAETVLDHCLRQLKVTHKVIANSHFGVSLRECPNCGQRFTTIFIEFVDWSGGDDEQYFYIVPVTAGDVADILAGTRYADPRDLGLLGFRRRYLASEWPTGGSKTISWQEGVIDVREGR
jgi:hypothetical protein